MRDRRKAAGSTPLDRSAGVSAGVAPIDAVSPRIDWRYLVAPALTLVLAALVAQHVTWMNGVWYWRWSWRDLPWHRSFPIVLLGMVPFAIAHLSFVRSPERIRRALAGVTTTALALQLLLFGFASTPFSLERVGKVIRSPDATSYFVDAQTYGGRPDLLSRYHEILPKLHLHSLTKPPGNILVYSGLLRMFPDPVTASTVAGLLIALVAALCVPTLYGFARFLGAGKSAAFHTASLMALTPSMQLFFPMLDQCYPHLTCALLATWVTALRRDDFRFSAAFGVVLTVICFFSYNLLVLGIVLGAISGMMILEKPHRPLVRVAQHGLLAIGLMLVLYVLAWLVTGFNAAATLAAAVDNQGRLLESTLRPYPDTVLFDLIEFVQGAGYLPVFLGVQYLALRHRDEEPSQRTLVMLFFVQLVLVALTGLLPGETNRVWMFMLPLALYGAGLELRHWPAQWRAMAYLTMAFLLSAIHANISFV